MSTYFYDVRETEDGGFYAVILRDGKSIWRGPRIPSMMAALHQAKSKAQEMNRESGDDAPR